MAVKWKAYAVLANAGAAVVVFALCLTWGLSRRAAWYASVISAFGFGSLYTLHDVFTADPLMYLLGPGTVLLLLQERVAVAGAVATVGVLAKEFVAAPLFIFTAVCWYERRWAFGWRVLAAANLALIAWLALQLTLIVRFNYGYGENPSTHLLSGGYLVAWIADQSPRGAVSAMVNVFGALWILAPAGLWFAPAALRRFTVAALPVALLFSYVQQPDRALWNFHFLASPLAALVLDRAPAALAWSTIGAFAFANLRLGAQLPGIPAARFAMALSGMLALAAIAWSLRNPAHPAARAQVPA
ncbi:MAG: hypothetical protein A3G81_15285 [Betaproteobacteria bacterium RIFCSPLOWO2_12_FULL_65_14]|nr:MAG: hypothetical protein A3G81_15285 [Betaproteobacteria bacterium RIFCSPLOWO2_12_FULL_65_14]